MYSLEFPHNIVTYKHRPKRVGDISFIHVESRKAKGFIRSHLHYYGIYESWHLQAHCTSLFLRECVYSYAVSHGAVNSSDSTHTFIYTE